MSYIITTCPFVLKTSNVDSCSAIERFAFIAYIGTHRKSWWISAGQACNDKSSRWRKR